MCLPPVTDSVLSLAKAVIGVVITSHWFGCIWGLQASLVDDESTTWIAQAVPSDCTEATLRDCVDNFRLYLISVYWAAMTITSIGYGDISANKENDLELVFATFLMLGGGMIWGQVVAIFVGEISTFSQEAIDFRRTMSDLNVFMRSHRFPQVLTSVFLPNPTPQAGPTC
jgi:hypothetical protein|eukprot:370597-Prymnesium_polylepis.2